MRSQKEEYNEMLSYVEFLKNEDDYLTLDEKKVINSLDEIINLDKERKILKSILGRDQDFDKLLYVSKENKEIYDLVIKHMNINYLKKLGEFIDSNVCVVSVAVDDSKEPKATFFDKGIVKYRDNYGYTLDDLNEDIINRVYDYLSNEEFIVKLGEGISLADEANMLNDEINLCVKANKTKRLIYSNLYSICEFNKVNNRIKAIDKELNTDKYYKLNEKLFTRRIELISTSKELFNKKKTNKDIIFYDELLKIEKELKAEREKLVRKLNEIDKNIVDSDLRELLINNNDNIDNNISIEANINKFVSIDFIDDYYCRVDKLLRKDNTKVIDLNNRLEEYKYNTRLDVIWLFTEDFDTCSKLVKLNKSRKMFNIAPTISLFVLKSLITMKNTSLEDMDLDNNKKVIK
jgi:hypothetical protein